MNHFAGFALGCLSLLAVATTPAVAQDADDSNNGTDPTRPISTLKVDYGYTDLVGRFTSDLLRVRYTVPLGEGRQSATVMAPFVSTDVLGRSGLGLGDIEVGYTTIPVLDAKGGIVIQASMIFDTADKIEHGTGKNVFKAQLTKAWFLKNGAIFAPSLVQSNSLWGDHRRADVKVTTIDFYYVPKMADPRNFVTIDPNVNWDWENDKFFPALAVTMGRVVGPAFGGTSQVYAKPSVFFGGERGADWGIEVGYKLLGF